MMAELSPARRGEIEEQAQRFWEEHGGAHLPVNPERMAKQLGFAIERLDLQDDHMTGMILVNDDDLVQGTSSNRVIVVNRYMDALRSRFIIAHELGHFHLHKAEHIPLFSCRDTDMRDETREEREAELFARALLMPRKYMYAVRKVYDTGDDDFDSLRQYVSLLFEVSEHKAWRRLKELGIPMLP